jgi:hypothetical protein
MSKPNKLNARRLEKYIRIFSEGEVTEIKYFDGIFKDRNLRGATIEKPKNHSPKGIVRAAIDAKKEALKLRIAAEDIHIWAVFDHDGHAEIGNAIKQAEDNGIRVAFSNKCFELWVLLHYKFHAAPEKNCDDFIKEVKKYNPKYCKEGTYDIYAELEPKIDFARNNGEKLVKMQSDNYPDAHFWDINPYTNVHELVDFLLIA